MKPLRLLPALLFAAFFSVPHLPAQEEGARSLTFQRYPYQFDSGNPLKPRSEILLEFSRPVSPDAVPRFFQLYDRENERFAPVTSRRPQPDEVAAMRQRQGDTAPLEHFAIITPANPLPLGGSWNLNARAGFTSSDGTFSLVESRLDYIGTLQAFVVDEVEAFNPYDGEMRIQVRTNKRDLVEGSDPVAHVSISPEPDDLKIEAQQYRIVLTGDFAYGTDYLVEVKPGIVAYDETQLNQQVSETVRFEPNGAFLAYPTFTTTQNAGGHRRFDIETGNMSGLRTRVKRLDGDDLVLAMREYSEKYEGWGEQQTLDFTHVPGETIHDDFRQTTKDVDEKEVVTLEWDALTEGRATGAFYLCSEGKSMVDEKVELGAQAIVQLTDIGMAWKQATDGTLLYLFSLATGEPLGDVSVRVLDSAATVLAEARTDVGGTARIDGAAYQGREEALYLDAHRGDDRHVIRFYEDLETVGLWSFRVDQRWDEMIDGERRVLLFADRNIYKPGHEVQLKAIARFFDEDKLLGPGSGRATLRVFDARHRKIVDREVTLDERGSWDGSFTLPTSGMGWHSVELDFNPAEVEHPDWRLVAHHSFQVEEYRVNTFEVTLDADDSYSYTEQIDVPLSARYYMGKNLSKAEMQWNVYAYGEYPRPRGFEDFSFGDRTADPETFTDEGETALSSTGEATIPVRLPEQGMVPGPRRVSVTAQVTDANQQTLSGSARFTVDSSDFYIGVREPEGVHRAGDTATFSLAAVAPDGEAYQEETAVRVLVEKEVYNTVKVMGANGRVTHRNDRSLRMVSEETIPLQTGLDPATGLVSALPHDLTFEEAGDYLITLTARDAQGRPAITRTRFVVIGAEEPSWSWYDVIRIDLIPDKTTYAPGDTARLLVRSPVFGHALLTSERGGVRTVESLEITDYETVVEIPVGEDAAPNIFASVLIVRGSSDSPHIHTSADYRLGYCELTVDDPAGVLDITLDTGEAEYFQPGEEVEVTTTIADSEGNPVVGAEVVLWAVDEGVLSLTAHDTPDPVEVFHASFPLAVNTGQSLSSLLPENPMEQDFVNKGYVIGGGGTPGLDPDRVRKEFKALAFWEPSLVTDAEGIVRATFTAPDNLTEFRLMAVVAEGNRFGSNEKPVTINKPLIVEPALPLFSNLTDQIDVTAVLHNNTKKAQEIELAVSLDDHGVFVSEIGAAIPTALADPNAQKKRTVTAILEAGATETLSFPVALTSVGEAKWNWTVRSLTEERLRDAVESTMPVGYPLPLLRESHSFSLRDGDTLGGALREVAPRLLSGVGEVKVSLSNSRLVEASDALDYLLGYPYGCAEQTTSSLIPWLTSTQLRKVMPALEKTPEESVRIATAGIQRLFSMQTDDGGLAYWPGGTQSELWASAYAGVAIATAQRQELAVPVESANALWGYLSQHLRNTIELDKAYDLSQRCLALYALALAGQPEPAYHEVLFEKRNLLSGEARALLALAMIETGEAAPDRVDSLLAPDPKVPVAEVSWYKAPYVAATRLLAQVRHDAASPRTDQLVGDLLDLRQPTRGWGSTYSNAWPLIALASYSEAVAGTLAANDVAVVFDGETREVALPAEPAGESLAFSFDGSLGVDALQLKPSSASPVYATVTIETRPELVPIEPENKGFAIARTYEKVETDGSIVPAEDLAVGDLILVTLDINLPAQRETYLAIDDPLPAVFEAVNPSFKTQETQRVNKDRNSRRLYTNHREIQKDRVLFFADNVFDAGDYSLQYLARVVAPGAVTAPPAKIEAMYEPQRFGLSGTGQVTASARDLGPGKVAMVGGGEGRE